MPLREQVAGSSRTRAASPPVPGLSFLHLYWTQNDSRNYFYISESFWAFLVR